MEIPLQKSGAVPAKFKMPHLGNVPQAAAHSLKSVQQKIKTIGLSPALGDYEKRKLGIFNQLNFLQLLAGILIPVVGLFPNKMLPASVCFIACLPALLSLLALIFNHLRKYELALLTYFILYPFFTCIVYINSMNLGVELNFVLYGILSVFFLQNTGYMMFTIAMSMMSYFLLSVVLKHFQYQLEELNYPLFLFNQLLAIVFIFYGLILIKRENGNYQFSILQKNAALRKKNSEIRKQKHEIAEKAKALKAQKQALADSNGVKDKLFSIVAHDLRAPLYGLRHLFGAMQQYDLPAAEVKEKLPYVLNDINYTIGLMENLLLWAKSQMKTDAVNRVSIDVSKLITEVMQLLAQQASAKNIRIEANVAEGVYMYADKEMIALVLRNLLSNAIKFTLPGGVIEVGLAAQHALVEVYVQDSGMGISAAALQQINANNYYTTNGTASESGTGLGLMLCKEF
ncbi:MAG TPA: HAMP domain-containing sensor histidine kinase, partial [Chitinophagaceae bacterium]|nr:HAMP domain-containing sensor histidine kinase [Chitinophagaceae bacterium]